MKIIVIQLSANSYFWTLEEKRAILASSSLISNRTEVIAEAVRVSKKLFGIGTVVIKERKNDYD